MVVHHRTSTGFVPPAAQRKAAVREHQKRNRTVQDRVLIAFLILFVGFFAVNLRFVHDVNVQPTQLHMLRSRRHWISTKSQPFNQNSLAEKASHLIMVAGHSVTISGHLEDAGVDEGDWFLLDYQKGKGLPQAIEAHIRAGIDEAQKDEKSLLIFSGGETRSVTGPLTEGSSYFHVADAMDLWPPNSSVRSRTTTEEFATDSFENLMFSICRFKEITGAYPTKITVISFSFKRRRFETLHAPALGWPKDRFQYIGVDPPTSTGFDLKASSKGEYENAAKPFEEDPYGCHSRVLQEKRKGRNPFSRTPPYPLSCPDLRELLRFCGPDLFPASRLPWNNHD